MCVLAPRCDRCGVRSDVTGVCVRARCSQQDLAKEVIVGESYWMMGTLPPATPLPAAVATTCLHLRGSAPVQKTVSCTSICRRCARARSGHQQSRGTPRCASACAVRAACGRCRRRHVVCCPAPAQLDALAQQEAQKKVMLERFQEEHPGFDFSGAEFNGMAPDPRTFMGGVKY
jgi:hypothetical protein